MHPITVAIIIFAGIIVVIAILFYKFHIKKKPEGEISTNKTVFYTDEINGIDRARILDGIEYVDSENKKLMIPLAKDGKRFKRIAYIDEIEPFDIVENIRSKEEHYVRRRHPKGTGDQSETAIFKRRLKEKEKEINKLGRKNVKLERDLEATKATIKRDIREYGEALRTHEQPEKKSKD